MSREVRRRGENSLEKLSASCWCSKRIIRGRKRREAFRLLVKMRVDLSPSTNGSTYTMHSR